MIEFVKGQWYQKETTKEYYQCIDTIHNGLMVCRRAGQCTHIIGYGDANDYTPVSLIPDFSNAKVGESCFDVELEHCEISEVREYDVYTMLMVDDDKGNLNPHIIYKDGYAHNPLLFNSFAQFQAYWAEQALEEE